MQISYQWLRQFLSLQNDPHEIATILTSIGLEVEAVEPFETIKGGLRGFVIGEVLTCERHPNADKLTKTTVDTGDGIILPVVCGAPNVAIGQKVILATVGATCYPTTGEPFTIQKAKIRGEVSEGMICAEDEIGLGKSHDGILVLDTNLPNGTAAATYFNMETDAVFTIGLTPNRVDAASHYGVARDLFAAISIQHQQELTMMLPDVSTFVENTSSKSIQISVEDSAACPRYAGVCIAGLKVGPSPQWLRQRLASIGVGSINNVVDATNYVLHELGQPLHAFDLDKIAGGKIIVKKCAKDTLFTTLDGKERKLSGDELMICDGEKPMCLAGVFGGIASGVSDSTTAIFLESAYFSPDSIRKTGQFHGLKTDASFRFERGTDTNQVIYALKRAALLIMEIAGGSASSPITDIYPAPIDNFKFGVSYKNINRLIGNDIPKEIIFKILHALDITVYDKTDEGFIVSVPPYRVDVQREADVIEEIIRVYGFENIIINEHPGSAYLADFPLITKEKIVNTIADLLVGKGFSEIMTNSLTKPEYAAADGIPPEDQVEIINKLSPELGVLRHSMLFSGLESISYNINRRQKDLRFFEFGKTYKRTGHTGTTEDFKEGNRLVLYMTGNRHAESWSAKTAPTDVYDIVSTAKQVLFALNINGYQSATSNEPWCGAGVVLEKNTKVLVNAGVVKPAYGKLTGIKQEVFYAEFNLDHIFRLVSNQLAYKEIAKYPEVRRDLSLVIDKKITFDQIQKLALKTERKLLRELNVFDVYQGDKISNDKKAYAISFIMQDEEQTLTDTQIDTAMQRLIKIFETELGAKIRI